MPNEHTFGLVEEATKPFSRRKFLGVVGAGSAVLATAAASCKKSDVIDGLILGSGDIGILNYAYLLEQLEAAYYSKVVATMSGKSSEMAMTMEYLTDIRNHEVAHREFFKAVLGKNAIPELKFNFSSVNFSSMHSVLTTAKAFEDLGVSAYNGAGPYIMNGAYLTAAGKIVSVEARHAALIRELLDKNSFADSTVVNNMGLDVTRTPKEVLIQAAPYLFTRIDLNHLPF